MVTWVVLREEGRLVPSAYPGAGYPGPGRRDTGFTSILYGMKRVGKENIPDKRLLANDFKTLQELEGFLPQFVSKPIVASVY